MYSYRPLIYIIGAFVLAAALLVAYETWCEHQREVGRKEVRAEWVAASLKAVVDARTREQELAKKAQEAIDEATKRSQESKKAADAARVTADGLRESIAAIASLLPGGSNDACREAANTFGAILGECAQGYQRVAEAADGHASDVRTCQDAWPKVK